MAKLISLVAWKGGVGKTTTSLHLAEFLSNHGRTLLMDGDVNRSALDWVERGGKDLYKFDVADLDGGGAVDFDAYDFIIVDTPARPEPDDFKATVEGSDLVIVPTKPDALDLGVCISQGLYMNDQGWKNYRVLLVQANPPSGLGRVKVGDFDQTRSIYAAPSTIETLQSFRDAGIPILSAHTRFVRAVHRDAAIAGKTTNKLGADAMRKSWFYYEWVGKEVLQLIGG